MYSFSRIDTFLKCPFKHWVKYELGYREKQDPEHTKYMDRGTMFHSGMEYLAQNKGELTKEEVTKFVSDKYKDSDFCDEAKETGIIAIERYLDLEEDKKVDFSNIIHTEYPVEIPLPDGNTFYGIVDAVKQNPDGTVTLIDYKTYSTAPQEEKMKYGMQGNLYIYAMEQLGFKVKDFIFECINPKAKLTGRNYTHKRIRFVNNEAKVEEYFNQFAMIVKMINENPEYRLYVPHEGMPDSYDFLYKVFVGDVMEDIQDILEKYFIKSEKRG